MKIGVKTFDDPEFLKYFEDKVDFFEVQAIRGNDYNFLNKFSSPIVIHAEHQNFGVNIADKSKEKENIESLNFAKKIADFCGAEKIIVHPSAHLEKDFIENSIDFLKKNFDSRILVENLPEFAGNSPEDIKKITDETGVEFCFDVNHSLGYPNKSIEEEFELIKKFLALNPKHFHIGGQRFIKEKLEHISLRDFDFNWEDILRLYPKDAWLTLEVTTDIKEVEKDLEYLKNILKKI